MLTRSITDSINGVTTPLIGNLELIKLVQRNGGEIRFAQNHLMFAYIRTEIVFPDTPSANGDARILSVHRTSALRRLIRK